MDGIVRDFRTALRGLRRTPSFAGAVILVLGLGIGMAAAMATVFESVLLRPLPVRDEDRLVVLWTYNDPAIELSVVRSVFDAFVAETHTLSAVGGYAHWGTAPAPITIGDRTLVLNRTSVTGNFFDVLGARPAIGRLLHAEDERAGAAPSMVISYATWQRVFGGDPAIVGASVLGHYESNRFTIVGVAPPGLEFPKGAEFWTPIPPGEFQVAMVGRLAPGAKLNDARTELASAAKRLAPEFHITGAHAFALAHEVTGDVQGALAVLTGAVVLLLLIACVNAGNLLLLRATKRERELAIRRALGASRVGLLRPLLLESALLAVAGGVVGVLASGALLDLLLILAPDRLPRSDLIALAGSPIGMASAVTVVTFALFGVGPTFVAVRVQSLRALRLDARAGQETVRRRRLRQVLVAAQVGLAVIMLTGAGLLGRTLLELHRVELGYEQDHLSLLYHSFPIARYDTPERILSLGDRLGERLRTIPGVTRVTQMLTPPYLGPNVMRGKWDSERQTVAEAEENPFIPFETGGTDYFRTFGIPIVRGRGFLPTDTERAPRVVVVSKALARRFWPDDDPIGKRLGRVGDASSWMTVVGVAGDVRLRSLRDATESVYLPWRQMFWQGAIAIRTNLALETIRPSLERASREVDPDLALWSAKTMDEVLDGPLSQPRLGAFLLAAFGLVALLLASIGLYAVMASVVREQTHELGVRMALGASPSRLQGEVIRGALVVTGAGGFIGIAIALGVSRLLRSLLYGVSPSDPVAFLGAIATLLLVAVLAAYAPARRATRIDPAQSLRTD